jgi:integrase
MALSVKQIEAARPLARIDDAGKERLTTRKLSDSGGLQLWCEADGGKRWRLAYRFNSKQRTLSIGVFPAVGLKEAREARDAAKKLLAQGRDPGAVKKQARAESDAARANTFAAIAAEVLDAKRRAGLAEKTVRRVTGISALACAELGERPISEITAREILDALRRIESDGDEQRTVSALMARRFVSEVFRRAVMDGRAAYDPVPALRGAIKPKRTTHRPAILDKKEFGALLHAVDDYNGEQLTRHALQLLALTFVRPGELRAARWSEFDFETRVWTIPASRMKMRREHRVPLSSQALAILRDLRVISGGGNEFVFPHRFSREDCLSETTMISALRRMGYGERHCAHGFRASASSMLNESGEWRPDAIEAQLAHQEQNAVRRSYRRNDCWLERVEMMQAWANMVDEMRAAASSAKAA